MRYQFEYFYIYKGKLLLGESIESMELLLELAAIERFRQNPVKRQIRVFSEGYQRAASPSR